MPYFTTRNGTLDLGREFSLWEVIFIRVIRQKRAPLIFEVHSYESKTRKNLQIT